MSEDDARAWIAERYGDRGVDRCTRFIALLAIEATRQNLISAGSWSHVWNRHVLDSAQLIGCAAPARTWFDIGSGAGFPGLIVGLLRDDRVTLIEPRRRRAEFLSHVVGTMQLSNIEVRPVRSERVTGVADIISARAVASVSRLFAAASHLAHRSTTWLLPKGESADAELAEAARAWRGMFHVEPSLTSDHAAIVVATQIVAR